MFTITSTRIVGLIAVVCAAVVAPQALASSTHNTAGDPSDVVQRYALRGEVSEEAWDTLNSATSRPFSVNTRNALPSCLTVLTVALVWIATSSSAAYRSR